MSQSDGRTNTTGVYSFNCDTCNEEIWIIPQPDGMHITYPDKNHDIVLPLQEEKKPALTIRELAWQLYQMTRAEFAAYDKAHPKTSLSDKEIIRLSKHIEAARQAWLICGDIPEGDEP